MTYKHPLEPHTFTFVRREGSEGDVDVNGWFFIYRYAGKLYRVSKREWDRYVRESDRAVEKR